MKIKNIVLIFVCIASLFLAPLSKAQETPITITEPDVWFYKAKDENANGTTILILPGGGYSNYAMDHEGHQWAPFFNELGINLAVLKYKLPAGNHEIPLNDVKKTIEILQSHADEWNINPEDIGIMGFSAGGHLASAYATHSEGKTRPAFQILFYPVISLKPEITHQASKDLFLGSDQSEERIMSYSGEEQVSSSTPPAILFHSYDDDVVVPDNAINYFESLRKEGVEATLHIYPVGGHGWGINEDFPYHKVMLEELSVWLKNNHKKE